jgi:hypothetical protein
MISHSKSLVFQDLYSLYELFYYYIIVNMTAMRTDAVIGWKTAMVYLCV